MANGSIEGAELGLLPHERRFIESILPASTAAREKAQEAVGEANANSGGDWAFDDPATQAAAQEAVLKDADYQFLKGLLHIGDIRPAVPYPEASDPAVQIGSRVTYQTPKWEETIDIVTRRIPGMPEDEENEVETVSAVSVLGAAVLGHTIGQAFQWSPGEHRTFHATVIAVDQEAQRAFYERVLEQK